MTLLCRRRGRGNWKLVSLVIDFEPNPLFLQPGMLVHIGDRILRIVRIEP